LDSVNEYNLKFDSEILMGQEALLRLIDHMPHLACLAKNKEIICTSKSISQSMVLELINYVAGSNQEIVQEIILDGFVYRIHTINLDSVLTLIILVKMKDIKLSIDPLTQLPSRDCFDSLLRKALEESRATRKIMSILFLDLDGFKVVNDTFGHEDGDVLLKAVACRISKSIRANDLCFRLGGDEFVVLLRDVKDRLHPCLVARRLIHSISEPVALSGSSSARVGCSIGIASYPFDGEDSDLLLKNSDEAMYRAKRLGKNNYQLFGQ
jgi:diguanylate cyclase (GGDEF)-like protein